MHDSRRTQEGRCLRDQTVETSRGSEIDTTVKLVRIFIWAQSLGFLLLTAALMLQDGSAISDRAQPINLIWPVLLLIALYVLNLDEIIVRYVSKLLLAIAVLVVSIASAAGSLANAAFFLTIPTELTGPKDSASAAALVFVAI